MTTFWTIIDDEGEPRGIFLTEKEAYEEKADLARDLCNLHDWGREDLVLLDRINSEWQIVELERVKV